MIDKFDYIELEKRLQKLTRKQRLYRLLKFELEEKGYWRNKPRGNPKKGFELGYGKSISAQGASINAQGAPISAQGAPISERPK